MRLSVAGKALMRLSVEPKALMRLSVCMRLGSDEIECSREVRLSVVGRL